MVRPLGTTRRQSLRPYGTLMLLLLTTVIATTAPSSPARLQSAFHTGQTLCEITRLVLALPSGVLTKER